MKITPQKYAKTLAFTFGVCRFVGRHFDTRLGQLIEMSVNFGVQAAGARTFSRTISEF